MFKGTNIHPRKMLVIVTILIALGLVAQQQYISSLKKYDSVNIYSGQSGGVNIFSLLSKKINKTNVQINKKAFHAPVEISNPPQILMILSPKIEVSKKESEFLADFVAKGGKLFLSAATLQEFKHIRHLTKLFAESVEVEENTKYKNGIIETLTINSESELTQNVSEFGIYSPLIFKDSKENNSFEKFFKELDYQKGTVYLNVGLPLFANGLLDYKQNKHFAFNLIENNPIILIDEYHHLFFEKTYWDLVCEPSITLPLVGMLILVVIFLLFSDSTKIDHTASNKQAELNYHKLNTQLIHGIWFSRSLQSDAQKKYAEIMLKKFPSKANDIKNLQTENLFKNDRFNSTYFKKLLILHKKILNDKGLR